MASCAVSNGEDNPEIVLGRIQGAIIQHKLTILAGFRIYSVLYW